METAELLARLRRPESLDALARLCVDELLSVRVGELVRPQAAAAALVALSRAHLSAEGAAARIEQSIADALDRLGSRAVPLHEALPRELQEALREVAGRPHTPDREVVLTLLDQPPLRALIRDVLKDALVGFGERLRAPVADSAVARGLGSLSRFALDQAVTRTGGLGALAAGVGSAVSAEVERQVEKRAGDHADSILTGILERLADQAADPRRAADGAALRSALLEGFLDLYTDEIAAELRRADPAAAARTVRRSLLAWLSREEAVPQVAAAVEQVIARDAGAPLREALEVVGVRADFERVAVELARVRLEPLITGERFAAWLAAITA